MACKPVLLVLALAVFPGCVDDGSGLEVPDEEIGSAMGTLSLEWSISAGSTLMSCPDVGAAQINIVATSADAEITETLSCFGGFGETGALPAGEYQVEVRLLDNAGAVLDNVGMGVVEVFGGHTAPLGDISFSM